MYIVHVFLHTLGDVNRLGLEGEPAPQPQHTWGSCVALLCLSAVLSLFISWMIEVMYITHEFFKCLTYLELVDQVVTLKRSVLVSYIVAPCIEAII